MDKSLDQFKSMSQLDRYYNKRNFHKTSEPRGKDDDAFQEPIFVIQKHDARNLHYDFRIAVEGVLKSWAVPKGPSLNKTVKRLAIRTEDHPVEYADFEGVIPEGEYGGGTILVWDKGRYRNLTTRKGQSIDLSQAIESGHFILWLEGKKIEGGFAMTRISKKQNEEQWLMVKTADEKADARRNPVETQPESVISGRDLDMIRKSNGE
jgi:DNA ligase D-like protein (predicted 3'-phosphoesterase)